MLQVWAKGTFTDCERTSRSSNARPKQQFGKRQNKARTHSLGIASTGSNNEETEDLAHIDSDSSAKVPVIFLDTSLHGIGYRAVASVSTIPFSVYKCIYPEKKLESTNVTPKPFGVGNRLTPKDKLSTTLQL